MGPEAQGDALAHKGKLAKLYVCTYSTHPEGYFEALAESAARLDIKLNVLGWGDKWEGFGQKYRATLNFLENLDPDDVVMMIDGFDVVLNQPAAVILERFRDHGGFEGRFITCAEGCDHFWMTFHNLLFRENHNMGTAWPDVPHFVPNNLKLQLLNAGCWITTIRKARELLKDIEPGDNDQKVLTAKYLAQNEKIVVDSGCQIFHLWRGTKAVAMVDVLDAWRRYPYRRPYYNNEEKALLDASPLEAGKRCPGEFKQTDLTRAAGDKVLVDLQAESIPCVIHIHCQRNIDYLTRQMGLPPMQSSTSSKCWYCWYSFQGHLAKPVAWWWALIGMIVFLVLGILGCIVATIGIFANPINSDIFLSVLGLSGAVVGLALVTLVQSLLYIDRPRRGESAFWWCGGFLVPTSPAFFTLTALAWISTIAGAIATQFFIWGLEDDRSDWKAIVIGCFAFAAGAYVLLVSAQIVDRLGPRTAKPDELDSLTEHFDGKGKHKGLLGQDV